ncbi:MAG: patatin-like phospholipase family protein [Myxococcales bacterium]|nr:patatin-like phospholipase family protein [Myxococcales bacterium]
MTLHPTADDALDRKIRDAVALFRSRSPLEEATLTLDGTGPNGPLQLAVMQAIGRDDLPRLGRVNVLSGSTFSFLGLVARLSGEHRISYDELIVEGDRRNRRAHRAGVGRTLTFLVAGRIRKRPMFAGGTHGTVLAQYVSDAFAAKRVADLGVNASFWLYDLDRKEPVRVARDGELGDATLAEVANCVAAVPRLYPAGRLAGRRFIDPVYSPAYRDLMKALRAEADNHLIANVIKDRTDAREIFLVPHPHGDGRKMIRGDFLRLAFNLPNPRIADAYRRAQRLAAAPTA